MDLWWCLESAKFIKGLTLSADFYHIDLRNATRDGSNANPLDDNLANRTGTLPNGAPIGGLFSDLIQRDPVTGAVLSVTPVFKTWMCLGPKVSITRLAISWIRRSSTMVTSGH